MPPLASPSRPQTAPPELRRAGPTTVLAASLLGFFVIALDALVVNVSLPAIGDSLSGGMAGLQWVVDGYTLMFAALMLSAGALSDRIGASRAFGGGIVAFTVSSAACGLAPTLWLLIGARLMQGAAAAVMMPASLALVRQAFPEAGARAKAIAIWTAGGAIAGALGPVAGGALTSAWSWRAVFFINVPVGLVALALLSRIERSPQRPAPLDLFGQVTGILALGALTYAVIDGGANGFSTPRALLTLLVAVVAAVAFVIAEVRQEQPMMPLALFRSRTVSVCVGVGFSINAAFYGTVFVLSLFFQQTRGQSALSAGLMFVPMTALVSVVNLFVAAWASRRFGPKVPMVAGQAGTALGLIGLLALDTGTPTPLCALVVIPLGIAGALAVPPLTATLLDSVSADRAGTAAGILNTARQVGGALAVAVFGALIGGGGSFQDGMRVSLVVAAVMLTAAALAALLLLPGRQSATAARS
jgi:MFS transporter, DHA2 family, methylenomycin A resistance protein